MSKVIANISMSLDGFIAGPNDRRGNPLGDGGERLHHWVYGLASWRAQHGLTGGKTGPADELVAKSIERSGAVILGRRMFECGEDPWGEEPPFHAPTFVVTHHPREPLVKEGTTFYFVTDGIESALRQAQDAAGNHAVNIAGGGNLIGQFIQAGLLDELTIHLVHILLGQGRSMFAWSNGAPATQTAELEKLQAIDDDGVTHLAFRVRK